MGSSEYRLTSCDNIIIPYPSLEAQRLIADYLDRETARIDTIMDLVGSRSVTGAKDGSFLALLLEGRAALITAAVTGHIPIEEMRP